MGTPIPASPPAPTLDFDPPPPLPPPPRVSTATHAAPDAKDDWRAQYRNASTVGREQTVLFVSGQWVDILRSMERQLALVGVKPLIPVDVLVSSIVLAVDELLPERISLTPKATAVIGTTSLSVQRFLHRDAIAKKLAGETEQKTPLRLVPDFPPPAPPPPPPPPPPVMADPVDPNAPEVVW
jgi:hypothetical protein